MNSTILGYIESEIDDVDWIMLSLVQANARISFADIGRRTGLSAPAAAERLRRLEDRGVIAGYHARINPDRLGLPMRVFIEITIKRADYTRFVRAISKVQWIMECHHMAGRTSFLLKAAVPDTAGLEQLIGHLGQFGETSTSLVLSTALERREFHHDSHQSVHAHD